MEVYLIYMFMNIHISILYDGLLIAAPGNCISAGFNWLNFTNAFDPVNHNPLRWHLDCQVVIRGATHFHVLVLFQIKQESLTKKNHISHNNPAQSIHRVCNIHGI